jgi:hypothetical protein
MLIKLNMYEINIFSTYNIAKSSFKILFDNKPNKVLDCHNIEFNLQH